MEKNKCLRCGEETSNPKYCSRECANKENTYAWAKGKTKEDDPRLAKIGEAVAQARKENPWDSWNKGLTKENSEKIRQASINMSKAKKNNQKAIESAKENLKKATKARSEKCAKQRKIKEEEKQELKNISQEIEKLKRIEKFMTQLKKYQNEKYVFENMTLKEKVLYYLYKSDCQQTKNNLHKDRDWFFNETKRQLYEETSFIEEDDINARLYVLFNDLKEPPKCIVCGKDLKWSLVRKSFPEFYCSKSCVNIGITWEDYLNRLKNYLEPLFSISEWKGKRECHKWKCKKCGTIFEDSWYGKKIPRCPNCYPIDKINRGISTIEVDIKNWLKDEGIEVIGNYRKYQKLEGNTHFYREIDIFLPGYNLGIELDGIYWHSEISGGKDRYYHKEKDEFFKSFNIDVLHFWDIEWIEKEDLVKSVILNKIGKTERRIYARKCKIQEIDKETAKDFLNQNHLQEYRPSSFHLGLYLEEELVQVVSIGKSRYNKEYPWEIIRLCSKINITVVGGFSKLLKYAQNRINNEPLVTYVDLRYGKGDFYLKNSFKFLNHSNPNYYYTKDYIILESRLKYQKHKLTSLLENFDPDISEWENMQLNGYDRVWDCGTISFGLK